MKWRFIAALQTYRPNCDFLHSFFALGLFLLWAIDMYYKVWRQPHICSRDNATRVLHFSLFRKIRLNSDSWMHGWDKHEAFLVFLLIWTQENDVISSSFRKNCIHFQVPVKDRLYLSLVAHQCTQVGAGRSDDVERAVLHKVELQWRKDLL